MTYNLLSEDGHSQYLNRHCTLWFSTYLLSRARKPSSNSSLVFGVKLIRDLSDIGGDRLSQV